MTQYVLIINCGSSSLKYAVIDPVTGDLPLKGLSEKLGHAGGMFTAETASGKAQHGGEYFSESVLVNEDVRAKIADCIRLAPLHNPAHVEGIDAALHHFGDLPQAVVFDTAFHQQMPENAYLYALPYEYYTNWHIRKYGFHGTSYRYIASQLPELLGKEKVKSIVCHLGNGGSVAAIDSDHSVDTTMGLTPLEGLVHGTRTGDIDPAIPSILMEQFDVDTKEMSDILWKRSGLLGLSGISNDCRTLEEEMEKGNAAAIRAMEVYCYRLAKHIGAQLVALGGCEVLVFTGGIGENSDYVRRRTVEHLAFLGFSLDQARNKEVLFGKTGAIHAQGSLPVWVVPTNEELLIARDTAALAAK